MAQIQDWPEQTKAINENLRELRASAPEKVMKAFGALTLTVIPQKKQCVWLELTAWCRLSFRSL